MEGVLESCRPLTVRRCGRDRKTAGASVSRERASGGVDDQRARRLLLTTPTLSARDAVHIAVMQGRDVSRILTFDVGFGGIPGIVRVG